MASYKPLFKVYGKEACSFCVKAKALLDFHNIKYEYFDVMEDEDAYNYITQDQGLRSVPQIYDNKGSHIGGYTQLLALSEKGELNEQ